MSLIPSGLVSGPALVPQPPLIPPVSAPQPIDSASGSKTDSGTSHQRDDASAFLSQGGREKKLVYDRPASTAEVPVQGFVSQTADKGTAAADVAAINKAEPAGSAAHAAANAAYAMVADAPAGMPPSVLTPLRGT